MNHANGTFDIVVIKTGYNDAARDFAGAVGVIVAAGRHAKGAQQVIWLTYSESTTAGSYNIRNGYLKSLVGSSELPRPCRGRLAMPMPQPPMPGTPPTGCIS